MKHTLILFLLLIAGTVIKAQDILTTKKGEDIKVKVTEVTPTEIKYYEYVGRKTSDEIHTVYKSDVFRIVYNDGRIELFNDAGSTPATQSESAPIMNTQTSIDKSSDVAVSKMDKMFLHNGKTIDGTIIRVDNYTIIYKYQGETSEQVIGKYAVEKIIHSGTGRVENITDKIIVNDASDWEKVVLLEDKEYTTGLTKVDEINGHTSRYNYSSINNKDKKAMRKLKMQAAEMGCPFILMTGSIYSLYQDVKKGIGYKY